jgi:hypothetical protein
MSTKTKPRYVAATMNPRLLKKVEDFAELDQRCLSSAIEHLLKSGLRVQAYSDAAR